MRSLVVEADTGFAIRVLREVVDYIGASARQLRGRFWARVKIDKAILKVLGFNENRNQPTLRLSIPSPNKRNRTTKNLNARIKTQQENQQQRKLHKLNY
ncbi:MAG: hypothetical protein ACPLW5_02400 [Candidatus Bathyarchaeales archaeon]